MLYRRIDSRCIYCGAKKKRYEIWDSFSCCPSDMEYPQGKGCSVTKKFITHKEYKMQKALGLR